jgi:asparagine synthase (glutamine-hydrolysing)
MCGICGVVGVRPDAGRDAARAMLDAMAHRGPDESGVHCGDGVALGACRLAIIGVENGTQPLTSPCSGLTVVANGEIYNHVELRAELRARGHRFATDSDCEVIAHLYEEDGERFVHRLRGMFAFALLDPGRRLLLLARDRMGEKPLYLYRTRTGGHVFASELKALLGSGLVPFDLDHDALREYLHYQYVPEPRTLVAGVRQLPAGTLLAVDLDTGKTDSTEFWNMEDAPPLDADPAAALRDALRDIGRIVVRSDVPIGVALSGGLDSAIVASLAAANAPGATAFSVGYAGRPAIDERSGATRTARALPLRQVQVELAPSDVVADFDTLVRGLDHPIADLAGPSYHAIARAAHEHGCRVLLFGHGGDELFWGYRWVRTARERLLGLDAARVGRARFYRHMEVVRDSARLLPGLCSPGFDPRLPGGPDPAAIPDTGLDAGWDAGLDTRLDTRLDPGLDNGGGPGSAGVTLPVRMTRLLSDTYLRSNGVAQTERLCMAHSVETRLPLLDHRFVDVAIGLRKHAQDADLPPKARLRAAADGIVPDFVLARRKSPFYTPTGAWHAALFAAYGERVADGLLRSAGIFTPEGAARAARGRTGIGSGSSISYKALLFESWHDHMQSIHRKTPAGAQGTR